jgi:uncharacterized protein YuzE
MEYKYDAETDILVIVLGSEKPDFGEQRENIITHYTKDGVPVEIEILDASKTSLDIFNLIKKSKQNA